VTEPNREQAEYWNATAGPKWVAEQEHLDTQLGPLGELGIARLGDLSGARILDVGCGCGAHALALARRAGPRGSVTGVDVSEPMLARARERAAGLANVTFLAADAQTHRFERPFDVVASRFGVMFFADFAAAFANLRAALVPGGRLGFVAWQPLERNAWMNVPLQVVARLVELPPPAPPGSPGPFGLDDPDRIRRALGAAGFARVAIDDVREPQNVGGAATLEDAVAFLTVAGPAAAALKGAPEMKPRLADALRTALAPYATPRGVFLPGAAWIVTAENPAR
jgi:SAM-dependent methyltransferase